MTCTIVSALVWGRRLQHNEKGNKGALGFEARTKTFTVLLFLQSNLLLHPQICIFFYFSLHHVQSLQHCSFTHGKCIRSWFLFANIQTSPAHYRELTATSFTSKSPAMKYRWLIFWIDPSATPLWDGKNPQVFWRNTLSSISLLSKNLKRQNCDFAFNNHCPNLTRFVTFSV